MANLFKAFLKVLIPRSYAIEYTVGMRELIRNQHYVSILLYHIVCPAKYRKAVFTKDIDEKLKEICEDIALRYEIEFLEIGSDAGHVHFFVQSVPIYSPKKIPQIIKSITAREILSRCRKSKNSNGADSFGRTVTLSARLVHPSPKK